MSYTAKNPVSTKALACAIVLSFVSAVLSHTEFLQPAALAQDELAKQSSWQPTSLKQVRDLVAQWADAASLDLQSQRQLLDMLDNEEQLLENPIYVGGQLLIKIFPQTQGLVDHVQTPDLDVERLNRLWSELEQDHRLPESARHHLRLFAGRLLGQNQLYDEALQMLSQLSTDQIVDPAALLFYQGVAQHRLLDKEACLKTLNRLLEHEGDLPRRFEVVAKLMIADIEPLKSESLDEIARMMDDVRRRISLHRSGTRVLDQEREVIEKLDDLIEDIEKQLQNQQQAAGSQQNPAKPMDDSQNVGGRGQGNVRDRDLKEGGSWGDIPPEQRAAALAEMVKDLPPHYRQVIEEYFRQLAKQSGK